MLTTLRKAEYAELIALFVVQGAAAAMWLVPLTTVLEANGLALIRPYAYAAMGLAAFISPLVFGAMADHEVSPIKVLRGLALASAVALAVVSGAIQWDWSPWLVLLLIQIYSLFATPLMSLASTIMFARLEDSQKEFGPIRGMYTFGWMVGCWIISALNADRSTRAGYAGAVTWLVVVVFTYFLPPLETPKVVKRLSLRQRLGWDAIVLLKHPDHRVVFVITGLVAIPLTSFYLCSPPHMRDLGLVHTSAWMTLGQITEMICMFSLGSLLARFRLKWIFLAGLGFTVLRFALCALNTRFWLLAGVFLHGASYALVYTTAQIYLDLRVDATWRARAQALISLASTGFGNLFGYLGAGAWLAYCTGPAGTHWPLFWSGIAASSAVIMLYFLCAYRGRASQ